MIGTRSLAKGSVKSLRLVGFDLNYMDIQPEPYPSSRIPVVTSLPNFINTERENRKLKTSRIKRQSLSFRFHISATGLLKSSGLMRQPQVS
jgi:hypothetical protein